MSKLAVCFIFVHFLKTTLATTKPNIIFILADDLGWNDVGFHGSSQIPTPNIDAMAYSGLILNNYYVNPICTPSRSALMTGKDPIHTGMQHRVLYATEPRGLPLGEKLLPQHLKQLGYSTHIVGKWHLGHFKKEYTPLYRGFDSHLGFWTGHHDYNDHTAYENPDWGLDMRKNMDVAWDLHGKYSTDIFASEAQKLIKNHNTSKPLFLYIAHAAVHSGNPYNPLPCPDKEVERFRHFANYERSRFAGMLTKLDESVGTVVKALSQRKMLQNSIIIFSSDNGGPAAGFNLNAASNWPLRGVKNTLWEGGVRAAGFLWSPLIVKDQRVAQQRMHITDWLPTLYTAAGGDSKNLGELDGLSIWNELVHDGESKRKEVLHNIDDKFGTAALTVDEWKLLKGSTYSGAWDHWYGPSGRDGSYDIHEILTSPAGLALATVNKTVNAKTILLLREQADVKCENGAVDPNSCQPLVSPCLFNIEKDPCEQINLAKDFPDVLKRLEERLDALNKTAIPPSNLKPDPRASPRFWNYTWTNFGDRADDVRSRDWLLYR